VLTLNDARVATCIDVSNINAQIGASGEHLIATLFVGPEEVGAQ
jgi:hypothetical protein